MRKCDCKSCKSFWFVSAVIWFLSKHHKNNERKHHEEQLWGDMDLRFVSWIDFCSFYLVLESGYVLDVFGKWFGIWDFDVGLGCNI